MLRLSVGPVLLVLVACGAEGPTPSEGQSVGDGGTRSSTSSGAGGDTGQGGMLASGGGAGGTAPGGGFEGYGTATRGAADCPGGAETFVVSSLGDAGPGTLREGLSAGCRRIVFEVGGTVLLLSDISIRDAFITIDGATAPAPGITIAKATMTDGEVKLSGNVNTGAPHDIIVTHLRFDGVWDGQEAHEQNSSTLAIDGEDHPDGIYNVIFDHLSFEAASDGSPDIWGKAHDITYSWCLFRESLHPVTISHSGTALVRERISLHHNVFARNHERNPQVRGDVRDLDFVNNVVFDWKRFGGGYGMRLRARQDVMPSRINIINNVFSSEDAQDAALIYGNVPGSADDGPGGVYPNPLWVNGNQFPAATVDTYATASAPIEVPRWAQVTTWPSQDLGTMVLPRVGTHYRTPEEQALIDEIASRIE